MLKFNFLKNLIILYFDTQFTAKRCHEISQNRQDELQMRLENDGSIPKKSDFIEILLHIWKDSMRILGNI